MHTDAVGGWAGAVPTKLFNKLSTDYNLRRPEEVRPQSWTLQVWWLSVGRKRKGLI